MPASRDPELLPDRAVRPVGGDDVARPDRPLAARLPVSHNRSRTVLSPFERHELCAVLEARSELRRALLQDRLEPDLRDEETWRGAQMLDAVVDRAEVPLELLATQRLHRHDGAVLEELLLRRRHNLVLDARAPVRLDRALEKARRTRVDRRAWVPLDDEVVDPVLGEEQRRRQPDKAAADDEDGDFFVDRLPQLPIAATLRDGRGSRAATACPCRSRPCTPGPLPAARPMAVSSE